MRFLNLILISSNWELNHREQLHLVLNEKLSQWSDVIFVEYPYSIFIHTLIKFKSRFLSFLKNGRNKNIGEITLFTPVMISHDKIWKKFNLLYKLDSFLISFQIKSFIKKNFKNHRVILWCYNPHNFDNAKSINPDYLIYDYYDNYSFNADGTPNNFLDDLNKKLCERSSIIYCTGKKMFDIASKLNHEVHLIPNGHNFKLDGIKSIQKQKFDFDGEIIGYIGNIRDWIDFELIEKLLDSISDSQKLVFIGPVEKNIQGILEKFNRHSRFIHVSKVPYNSIPKYIKGFDVGIIPFKLNNFTEGVLPNKFFEYLVCGIKIVATNLPDLQSYSGVANIANTHEQFINFCKSINNLKSSNADSEFNELVKNSHWESRGNNINNILKEYVEKSTDNNNKP